MTFSGLVSEGWTSSRHVHAKGLHLGRWSIHIENISCALKIWNRIWTLVVGARVISQCKLRVFLAELLPNLFKVFALLLISGELGADVLSAAISTTSRRSHRCYTSRSTTNSRVSIARVLLLRWLIRLALIQYFLSVKGRSWAWAVCQIGYTKCRSLGSWWQSTIKIVVICQFLSLIIGGAWILILGVRLRMRLTITTSYALCGILVSSWFICWLNHVHAFGYALYRGSIRCLTIILIIITLLLHEWWSEVRCQIFLSLIKWVWPVATPRSLF